MRISTKEAASTLSQSDLTVWRNTSRTTTIWIASLARIKTDNTLIRHTRISTHKTVTCLATPTNILAWTCQAIVDLTTQTRVIHQLQITLTLTTYFISWTAWAITNTTGDAGRSISWRIVIRRNSENSKSKVESDSWRACLTNIENNSGASDTVSNITPENTDRVEQDIVGDTFLADRSRVGADSTVSYLAIEYTRIISCLKSITCIASRAYIWLTARNAILNSTVDFTSVVWW